MEENDTAGGNYRRRRSAMMVDAGKRDQFRVYDVCPE
jgi:hypothetical protein